MSQENSEKAQDSVSKKLREENVLKSTVMSFSFAKMRTESVSDLEKLRDESLREGFGKAIETKFRTSGKVFRFPSRVNCLHLTWDFLQMPFWSPGLGNLY